MSYSTILLSILAAGLLMHVAVCILPHFPARGDEGGDQTKGVLIFSESIRWLGVRWGMRSVTAGLRAAGYKGEVLYWQWHAGWRGWLVIPALRGARSLENAACELAKFIETRRVENPARPIYLVGYSAGGYVAVRALELLKDSVEVDSAALLAAAIDPRRNLAAALSHIRSRLVICSSLGDWCICGLGTLVLGTCDGRHGPSMGMVARRPQSSPSEALLSPTVAQKIVEIRWRPGMIRSGNWGGHFSAPAAGYIARYVAPAMRIA